MSDFFGDDFTAELKSYFLDSVIKETEKFMDLLDDALWKRIRSEVSEQTRAWAVDAKTNEFSHFSEWLESFASRSESCQNATEFLKALKAMKEYAELLLEQRVDSSEVAAKFSMVAESRREILFLKCKWGSQDFAIPLLNVVEISSQLPLYPLPQQKPGLLGVIPFRGEAIPVVSFKDHGFKSQDLKNMFYVICEHEGVRFSLQVTETDDLVGLRESELQSVEENTLMIQASFVKQFFIKDSKNIMILDLEKLVA